MTAVDVTVPAGGSTAPDHRGSWVPNWAMITTRVMELRTRRGLMVALTLVTIGIPAIFMAARLVLHAVAPKTYGPAGGYDIYVAMAAGVLYVFGFIVAATLGATAGSADLTDGMFRHMVISGRSRLALYLARVPAGLAIIVPMVAAGFALVCAVCVFAAPSYISYEGVKVPAGLSQAGFTRWAEANAQTAVCRLPFRAEGSSARPTMDVIVSVCGPGGGPVGPAAKGGAGTAGTTSQPTAAQLRTAADFAATAAYPGYTKIFRVPSTSLMVKTGLWLELEAVIGFMVGLGLGSLIGQRTVAVILMIVLEIILTPIMLRAQIPHMINLQRSVVGIATDRLEPGSLRVPFGGGGQDFRVTESLTVAISVILAWLTAWTALGAWRMTKRDA